MQMMRRNKSIEHGGYDKYLRRDIEETCKVQSENKTSHRYKKSEREQQRMREDYRVAEMKHSQHEFLKMSQVCALINEATQ
jgi:hypothetical protein